MKKCFLGAFSQDLDVSDETKHLCLSLTEAQRNRKQEEQFCKPQEVKRNKPKLLTPTLKKKILNELPRHVNVNKITVWMFES